MKFKWHWGIGIAVVYTGFVLIRIITIIISERNDVDLVAPDYYARAITYEERIQAVNNAQSMKERIAVKKENRKIIITFPAQFKLNELSGNMVLFRPSDKRMDKTIQLKLDSNFTQAVSLEGLQNGYWKIQISWNDTQKKYYEEFPLVLN